MNNNIYLLDANTFLTPSKDYYRFSIAPSYWNKINRLAEEGLIKTIDKVNKELSPRTVESKKDDIQQWYENIFNGEIINTKQQEIFDEYRKVIEYLNASEKYNEKAFLEWSSNTEVADPWLIATAKAFNYTVITMEKRRQYSGNPLSKAKIPNICEDLNVRYISLFNMMEELEIIL